MADETDSSEAGQSPAPQPAPEPAGPTDDQVIGLLVGTETRDAGGVMDIVHRLVGEEAPHG